MKDSTLVDGLKKIKSPLDFLDIFPLFGTGLNIKRADGTLHSPWKASVKGYSNIEIETSTFDFTVHVLEVKKDEVYNCVCPLIPKEDAYLAPLYQTELMRYLISYDVTEQLDHINDDSHLLVLSDLFVLAYKAEDHDMVNRVLDTVNALKAVNPLIGSLIEAIEVEDLGEYAKFPRKSSQVLLHYYVMKRSDVTTEEKVSFMQRLWVMYYRYRLKNDSVK